MVSSWTDYQLSVVYIVPYWAVKAILIAQVEKKIILVEIDIKQASELVGVFYVSVLVFEILVVDLCDRKKDLNMGKKNQVWVSGNLKVVVASISLPRVYPLYKNRKNIPFVEGIEFVSTYPTILYL